ncbi:hypothetical protein BKA65DRAFT_563807 [Rhexocercosporidium sp. MPI-PUGE-AT-0058]|nr:hypothetical protein BKA65DRAFT_563807 [Rhexocercosporidium sp. MPI-PUGE-AT-0058]
MKTKLKKIYLIGFLGLFASTALPLIITSISVTSELMGNITSTNTEDIRDLGFSGTIGNIIINTHGDTLTCGDGSAHGRFYQTPPYNLLPANSTGYIEADLRDVTDFNLDNNRNPPMFCGYFEGDTAESKYRIGLTNMIAHPGSSTE